MNVLRHWSDEDLPRIANRLPVPTAPWTAVEMVREVLKAADAVPAVSHQGAVELLRRVYSHADAHQPIPADLASEVERALAAAGGQYQPADATVAVKALEQIATGPDDQDAKMIAQRALNEIRGR